MSTEHCNLPHPLISVAPRRGLVSHLDDPCVWVWNADRFDTVPAKVPSKRNPSAVLDGEIKTDLLGRRAYRGTIVSSAGCAIDACGAWVHSSARRNERDTCRKSWRLVHFTRLISCLEDYGDTTARTARKKGHRKHCVLPEPRMGSTKLFHQWNYRLGSLEDSRRPCTRCRGRMGQGVAAVAAVAVNRCVCSWRDNPHCPFYIPQCTPVYPNPRK